MTKSLLKIKNNSHKNVTISKTKILIFIGSLRSGGKERRLIELLTYLKDKEEFKFFLVLTEEEIHYPDFYKLDIPYYVLPKKWKKNDLTVFYQFYKVCEKFKPHLIHSWGRMQTFYALPAVLRNNICLINSQITSAPPKSGIWSVSKIIDIINFRFSKVILSNSWAGLNSYNPPKEKSRVIYNGINMNRFIDLPDPELIKEKYGIHTPYSVLMSASFSNHKDHELFIKVAEKVTLLRDDITFISVGGHDDSPIYRKLLNLSLNNPRIVLPGRINDVEALINACTLGVLFSNKSVHGEGISNSVMEYMSLSKPVIANDAGGTKEIVHNNENGYLIITQSEEEIAAIILELINNRKKREAFGQRSKNIIDENFSLEKMGKAFELVYKEALA